MSIAVILVFFQAHRLFLPETPVVADCSQNWQSGSGRKIALLLLLSHRDDINRIVKEKTSVNVHLSEHSQWVLHVTVSGIAVTCEHHTEVHKRTALVRVSYLLLERVKKKKKSIWLNRAHSKAQNKQRLYPCIVPCLADVWYVSGCNRISRLQPHKWVKITYTSAEIDYYTTNLGSCTTGVISSCSFDRESSTSQSDFFVGSCGSVIYEMKILLWGPFVQKAFQEE